MRYTQGSVIYGLRSAYYDNIPCLGVIITARCEIAQDKAKVIHALSALSLNDWVRYVLFNRAVEAYAENDLSLIRNWAKQHSLDYDTLIAFGPEKIRVNLQNTPPSKKDIDKIEILLSNWENVKKVAESGTEEEILLALNGPLKKRMLAILKDLMQGKLLNEFCFIPDDARLKNGKKLSGIVVNLKDIIPIHPAILELIQNGGIEYEHIKTVESKLQGQTAPFYLKSKSDFVDLTEPIQSPWIEYLLQNFSHAFSRIGVDSASKDEISEFCNQYCYKMEGLV